MTLINWRLFLYYPLGILPMFFFTLRMLLQWLQSEKKKQSYVGPLFWRLSLTGNFFLCLHYFIQYQFPFSLLQMGNGLIAWRHLHLMKKKNPYSMRKWLLLAISLSLFFISLYFVQSYVSFKKIIWLHYPLPNNFTAFSTPSFSIGWHLFGSLGVILFYSRFWFQWWQTEKKASTEMGSLFWWLSIIGSLSSLLYFSMIKDVVSILLHGFGLVPYIRNLVLKSKNKKTFLLCPSK